MINSATISFQNWEPVTDRQLHVSVLKKQVIEGLNLRPDRLYVDGTVGMGGHAEAILEACPDIRMLICVDWDEDALQLARGRLEQWKNRFMMLKSNYADLPELLLSNGIEKVDGILLDIGLSSFQLEHSGRGFSFNTEEPLDMRMDRFGSVMASDLVNNLPVEAITEIIRIYGEERWAKRIAERIAEQREQKPIHTSGELARLIYRAIPRKFHPRRIHPATRTFQALRIAVNRELDNLKHALDVLPECLNPGGRLCIISFHSLEDRLVKFSFRDDPRLTPLTKRPLTADDNEIKINPRSRSAKLRIAERIEED